MECTFEYEYDGTHYTVEAEYKVVDASYDHEFGRRKMLSADCVGFKTFVAGAPVILIDDQARAAIWKACDKQIPKLISNLD